MEILVSIAVVTILLAIAIPGLRGTGTSERRASAAKVSSMLTHARAEAVATGEVVGLVFMPIANLPDDKEKQAGRAMALFALRQSVPGQPFTAIRQLGAWEFLDTGIILASADPAELDEVNPFAQAATLRLGDSVGKSTSSSFLEDAPFVAFSPRGTLIYPEVTQQSYEKAVLGLWEGHYRNGAAELTRKLPEEVVYLNRIEINRLSGRARVKL